MDVGCRMLDVGCRMEDGGCRTVPGKVGKYLVRSVWIIALT